VDVVLTRASELGGKSSQTILHNVRVLAIDARLGGAGQPREAGTDEMSVGPEAEVFHDGAIATLALDPRQAEVIINATASGQLSLILRSVTDFAEVDRSDINQKIRMTSPFWTK
jgi:pilus assembly protein CpaB